MFRKLFWSVILLAAYVGIMFTEQQHLVISAAKEVYSMCVSFLDEVKVYRK